MKVDSRQREQLFVYPLGLTKTLQEFNLAAPTRTAASKKYQPTTTKYQPIRSISKYTQEKTCAEVYF